VPSLSRLVRVQQIVRKEVISKPRFNNIAHHQGHNVYCATCRSSTAGASSIVNYVPACTQKVILDHFVSDIRSFKRCIRMQRNELPLKRKSKKLGVGREISPPHPYPRGGKGDTLPPSAPRSDRLRHSDSIQPCASPPKARAPLLVLGWLRPCLYSCLSFAAAVCLTGRVLLPGAQLTVLV